MLLTVGFNGILLAHHGAGKKKNSNAYSAVSVTREKIKPEEDAALVKDSTSWNGVRGLSNLGNTCFFNSVMQCLVQTVPLRTHLVPRDPFEPSVPANRAKPSEGAVSAALRSTILQMWLGAQRTYDPSPLFGAIETKVARFRRKQQQDAHELLRVLMDLVDTEILAFLKKYKSEYLGKPMPTLSASQSGAAPQATENGSETKADDNATPNGDAPADPPQPRKLFTLEYFISRQVGNLMRNEAHNLQNFEKVDKSGLVTYVEGMFGGRVESTLMCHACGTTSTTHESFLDLSVPIPTRFLDDRVKRSLGFIPSLNKPTNLKASLKNSKGKGKAVVVVEDSEDAEDAGEEDSFLSYKQDYDCETLSSMGGPSAPGGSKKKIVPKKEPTQLITPTVKLTATQAEARVKMRLAAAAKRKEAADAKAKKAKKPKKLNKRDKKMAQLRQQAEETTLEVNVDLSGLTEEQIMMLALADDSQDIEALYHHMTEGEEDFDEPEAPGAAIATDTTHEAISSNEPAASAESAEQVPQVEEKGVDAVAGDSEAQPQAAPGSSLETAVEAPEQSPTSIETDSKQDEPVGNDNVATSSTDVSVEAVVPPAQSTDESKQGSSETSNSEEKAEDAIGAEKVKSVSEPQPPSIEVSEDVSTNTLDTSSSAATEAEASEKLEETESKDDSNNQPTEPSTATATPTSAENSLKPNGEVASKPSSAPVGLNPNLKHDARTISRPVHLSVDACLFEFTEPEVLAGTNAYGCYECTKRQYLKDGRDLTPLILDYGSDAEKQALNPSATIPTSEASSAPTEKEEAIEIAAKEVSELSIETEEVEPTKENGQVEPTATSTSETEEPKIEGEEKSEEEKTKVEAEKSDTEEPNGTATATEDEESSEEEEIKPLPPMKPTLRVSEKNKLKTSSKSLPLVRTVATKQILIDEVPQVLTVHLKRFWTSITGSSTKLENRVEFPTVLDLSPYISRSLRERYENGGSGEGEGGSSKESTSVLYQLYGIVVHSGSMSGGHYIAYTRRREQPISDKASLDDIKNGWHYFSDSSASAASLESVLNQQAYILFYERISE